MQQIYDNPKLTTNNPVLFALRSGTTVDEAMDFLSRKTAVQMRKESHRPPKTQQAPAGGGAGHYQADLMMLDDYRGVNNMKRMLLTILNTTSRYAYARPIADKKANTVRDAIQQIFDGVYYKDAVKGDGKANIRKTRPLKDMAVLRVDGGTEFMNGLEGYLKEKKIGFEVSAPYRHGWLARTNRFHRTLRQRLGEHFARKNTHRYVDVLQDILDNYNNTPHITLTKILGRDASPQDITSEDEKKIRQHERKKLNSIRSHIFVGDLVRLKMSKTKQGEIGKLTQKGQQDIWSRRVYEVKQQVGVNTFIVDVDAGEIELWYDSDLQVVSQKDKQEVKAVNTVNVKQVRAQRDLDRDLGDKEERQQNIIPDIVSDKPRRAVRIRAPSKRAIENAQR